MNTHSRRDSRTSRSSLPGVLCVLTLALMALFVLSACDENDNLVDLTPPATPDGVDSITGDQVIWIQWNANREPDLAGYRVYSTTETDANLEPIHWQILAEIGTPFPDNAVVKYYPDVVGGQPYLSYEDRTVTNGYDYYYAISAFDEAGNESPMSTDYVVDTPRPEGHVTLSSANTDSSRAGFDFSDEITRYPADNLADLIYDVVAGIPLFTAQAPWVRVQDYGNVDFDTASWAPELGWSQAGTVEAIVGHSYFFEINDDDGFHYAKVHVDAMSPGGSSIQLMWGYQPVDGLPELKQPLAELPPRGTGKEG